MSGIPEETLPRPMYFGPHEVAGHFVWWRDSDGTMVRANYGTEWVRWLERKDGSLAPSPDVPGHGAVTVLAERVTVLAWWDRSVDSRGASNGMFVLEGVLTFDDMLGALERAFPEVWNRQKVQIHR